VRRNRGNGGGGDLGFYAEPVFPKMPPDLGFYAEPVFPKMPPDLGFYAETPWRALETFKMLSAIPLPHFYRLCLRDGEGFRIKALVRVGFSDFWFRKFRIKALVRVGAPKLGFPHQNGGSA